MIYQGIVKKNPEFREHNLSSKLENLLRKLLEKDPTVRYQDIREIKAHPWLHSINWTRVKDKGYEPPIVPGPHSCCIDEEFLNLPLDFEDSSIPVPTERRQSCYYESTIMLNTMNERATLKTSFVEG